MLNIEIELNDIDFNKIIENKIPEILQKLSVQDSKLSKLARILLQMDDVPVNMITSALNVLSQQEKEELIINIFNEYKEEAIVYINSLIQENISAEIMNIRIKRE